MKGDCPLRPLLCRSCPGYIEPHLLSLIYIYSDDLFRSSTHSFCRLQKTITAVVINLVVFHALCLSASSLAWRSEVKSQVHLLVLPVSAGLRDVAVQTGEEYG